ncbi:MAG: glycosyltransferase, partial [Myxococcales bacterium]|nr:glycosyltransferase [Myxococcales bacterium]
MRVAHVLRKYDPRHWGGTESAVLELLRGLEAQGVESVVYAPRLDEPAGAADPIADLGIEVRRFGAFLPTLGISPEARARSLSVGGNIVSFSAPRMLFFDRKVDLVHSHVLGRLGGAARTVARLRGLPFVVSIHGGYLDIPPNVRDQLEAPTRGGFEYGRAFGALMGA